MRKSNTGRTELLRYIFFIFFLVMGVLSCGISVGAAELEDYSSMPPFLATELPPNVMVMLDNSGSMKEKMYGSNNNFNSTASYYGMFDETKTYIYNTTIEVDINGYNGFPYSIDANGDSITDSNDVDAPKGAFIESTGTCTPGPGTNCWSGKFLNWLVTRKIDAARCVLVGGKVESRAGYDYTGDTNLEWKIVANNEAFDHFITNKSSASGQLYTPFPNNTKFKIASPADNGNVRTKYDPYAKLSADINLIYNSTGTVIGEAGMRKFKHNWKDNNWLTVDMVHSYTDPVVVAVPLSFNGPDPSVARISDVDAASKTFKVRIEEWEYKDGGHTKENLSYIVLEKGQHTLPGGKIIIAGSASIGVAFTEIALGTTLSLKPVVISSVTTNNDDITVTTRQKAIDTDSFEVRLQEEENQDQVHSDETVTYVAFEQGNYGNSGVVQFEVGIETDVNQAWKTISFTGTHPSPLCLSAMQTTNDLDPASLRYKKLESGSVDVKVEEEKSKDNEILHNNENVGYIVISFNTSFNLALVVKEEPEGLLHDVIDQVRLGISFYKFTMNDSDNDIYHDEKANGGTLHLNIPKNPFVKKLENQSDYREINTPIKSSINTVVDAVEHYPLVWGTTPLAENYFEVIRYFQQVAPYYDASAGNTGNTEVNYQVNNTWDPYYFAAPYNQKLSCVNSNILVFTDGKPWLDGYVPENLPGYNFHDFDGDSNSGDCYSESTRACENNLNDLAKWAHCADGGNGTTCSGDFRDLRSDLANEQYLTTYTVAFGKTIIPRILQDTADYGGGVAYLAKNGEQLKTKLRSFFDQILGRSSGTAASVISNTRGGEGAIYQSVFFPKIANSTVKVNWVGQVHALLVDSYGNMRENTNHGIPANTKLDLIEDYFVVFNEDGTAKRYLDGDGNQRLELDITTCPKIPPAGTQCYDSLVDVVSLDDLKYLWNTSNWLNEISDTDVEIQRPDVDYISDSDKRHIFTWVDDNNNSIVNSGETRPFEILSSTTLTETLLKDRKEIYPYLHLFPSFINRPGAISSLSNADLVDFLEIQTRRQINYVRGSDCASTLLNDCNTQQLTISGTAVPGTAMRSRQYDYDNDGDLNTWRLGDIVYSTPTLVGRPAENLHLLYRDSTYALFAYKYRQRRQVIYAGANDGMVHAFNAGFYDFYNKQFCKSSDFTKCADATKPDLGAELWAYVPNNLLPHLYWLTDPSYNETKHIYYVDQQPRIFDAKIFQEETDCSTISDPNCIHPKGWGTVMVVGMNLGGGSIIADIDKTDGNSPTASDPTMKSAFLIFDITNPEKAPTLLAELKMPKMGFATCHPTVLAMKDGNGDKVFGNYASGENRWYLAFGSGPAAANGDPGTVNSMNGNYNNEILEDVKSLQPHQFYLLDLVKLARDNQLRTLDNTGTLFSGLTYYTANDTNSFVSHPVTVDYDLDYNGDAIYFGTVNGVASPNWGGKLRRIVTKDDNDPAHWIADSVLIDAGKPITASPVIGMDDKKRNWVFFGTGRYFSAADKADMTRQKFYGLKEPIQSTGPVPRPKAWTELTDTTLTDVTDYKVYTDGSVFIPGAGGSPGTTTNFSGLLTDQLTKDGWYRDFTDLTGERNLGKAALLGALLSFTTFTPEADVCSIGGTSDLWALYYKTGTAHFSAVLGSTVDSGKHLTNSKKDLGKGLATTPNIHIGREEGSAAFVQSSTGEITRIHQKNPESTKSGVQSWKQN